MAETKSLNETLRHARLSMGLQQKVIADILGLSREHYSNVECGRKRLLHEHFAGLPEPMRREVVNVAIAAHEERINRLRALLDQEINK